MAESAERSGKLDPNELHAANVLLCRLALARLGWSDKALEPELLADLNAACELLWWLLARDPREPLHELFERKNDRFVARAPELGSPVVRLHRRAAENLGQQGERAGRPVLADELQSRAPASVLAAAWPALLARVVPALSDVASPPEPTLELMTALLRGPEPVDESLHVSAHYLPALVRNHRAWVAGLEATLAAARQAASVSDVAPKAPSAEPTPSPISGAAPRSAQAPIVLSANTPPSLPAMPTPAAAAPPPAPVAVSVDEPVADELSSLRKDDVAFTVYRPRALVPSRWAKLLAFAHLAQKRPDAPADEPDPLEQVKQQAQALLGPAADHRTASTDAGQPIPLDARLTFVLSAPGVEVEPERAAIRWLGEVQHLEFRLRAPAALGGTTVYAHLSVLCGSVVVGDLRFSLPIAAGAAPAAAKQPALEHAGSVRMYRKIFASYSHADAAIVGQFRKLAKALGDRYLIDVSDLRAGEKWSDALEALIRDADVFQLFWSQRSMRSQFVRQEWEYALSLGRDHFIRPTYWEQPMPSGEGLPPPALAELHFESIADEPARPARPAAEQSVLIDLRELQASYEPPVPQPSNASPRRIQMRDDDTGAFRTGRTTPATPFSRGADQVPRSRPGAVLGWVSGALVAAAAMLFVGIPAFNGQQVVTPDVVADPPATSPPDVASQPLDLDLPPTEPGYVEPGHANPWPEHQVRVNPRPEVARAVRQRVLLARTRLRDCLAAGDRVQLRSIRLDRDGRVLAVDVEGPDAARSSDCIHRRLSAVPFAAEPRGEAVIALDVPLRRVVPANNSERVPSKSGKAKLDRNAVEDPWADLH